MEKIKYKQNQKYAFFISPVELFMHAYFERVLEIPAVFFYIRDLDGTLLVVLKPPKGNTFEKLNSKESFQKS